MGQVRTIPDPRGLRRVGRPSPKPLCIPQDTWGRTKGHQGRCCLEEEALDSWEGLVSQGRAEKGLLGGREALETV